MSKIAAVDTNVLIYLHDNSNSARRDIAKNILADTPVIPTQVISEYLNTMKRLTTLPKEQLLFQTAELFKHCSISTTTPATLQLASTLVKKYLFQLFDAVVVAAALEAGCEILYSEDMHNSLLVNRVLTITNPFI